MVRTSVARLAIAAALCCTAAACSAEAGPRTAPSPTASPSPLPTTSPTTEPTTDPTQPVEPTLPAAAKASTRAGAEAFVRYYIQLVNYAGRTGDTAEMKRRAAGCTSCTNLAGAFQETYAQGGEYTTQGWQIQSQFTTPDSRGNWVSLLEVRQARIVWVRKAGAEPERFPAKRLNLRFEIERHGGGWFVSELTQS